MSTTSSSVAGVKALIAPMIVIQDSGGASSYGFAAVNTSWVFGTVVATYANSMKYVINDIVLYDKTKGIRFKYGSINYFVIDEQYIYFVETPVL